MNDNRPESENSLEDKLRNILRCNVCFHFLTPPLLQCEEAHIICGKCSKNKSKCAKCDTGFSKIHIPIISEAIHLIKFPCCFADFGCEARLSWDEILEHEGECYWRLYICPKVCTWKGRAYDLKQHFEEKHANCIIKIQDEYTTTLSESDITENSTVNIIKLLCTNDRTFIFTIKKDSRVFIALQLVGKKEDAEKFDYSVNIKNPGIKFYLTQQQQVLYDFDRLDPDNTPCVNLNLLHLFQHEKEVTIHVMIIPKGNIRFNPILSDLLSCPICSNFMKSTVINLCDNGHSICHNCRLQVAHCPICRAGINSSRNYALEDICQVMDLP